MYVYLPTVVIYVHLDLPAQDTLMGDGPTYHWKTRICYSYEHGRCEKGKTCHFAHSEKEMKQPGQARHEWEEKLKKRGVTPPSLMPQGGNY